MSNENEFDPKKFDDAKARRWLGSWVSTVDNPQLTWAWDAVAGVIDVYAALNLTRENTLESNRRELWHDWFSSWDGGEAHYGVHGVMQEFAFACPEEIATQQLLTVEEAFDIGRGKSPSATHPSRRKAPKEKPSGLRIVVDNTNTGGK